MKSFFKRVNLIDSLSLELNLDLDNFINKLEQIVDEEPPYLFDELYGSKKIYCGKVERDHFYLRKKRKFMNMNIQSSRANGTFICKKNKTKVDIEILGYDNISTTSIIVGPIFFLILFLIVIINEAYPALIIVIPLAILIISLPYLVMKSNMKKFKNELKKNLMFK